jgi:hypothetical protein
MSSPLHAQTRRQAVNSIGGTLYQIWQSVLTWVTLAESEILYLEGAEDFDVAGSDRARAVQVRRTADPISLGSAKIIETIGNFWQLSQANAGAKLTFRYLTTSLEQEGSQLAVELSFVHGPMSSNSADIFQRTESSTQVKSMC